MIVTKSRTREDKAQINGKEERENGCPRSRMMTTSRSTTVQVMCPEEVVQLTD